MHDKSLKSSTKIVSKTLDLNMKNLVFNPDSKPLDSLSIKSSKKYKIEKTVATGGMKAIRLVRDCDIGRQIAVAEMLPEIVTDPQKINRFIQEARITANLEHPNIVPVHELGKDVDNTPYFVMKMLSGETLSSIGKKMLKGIPEYKKKYNLHHRLEIFLKVCNAVAFAHSKGVVHLDIKPSNIQVGDFGDVLLLDWGLAKVLDERKPNVKNENIETFNSQSDKDLQKTVLDVTLDGVIKGTPGYMAPEQVYGKNSQKDQQTDIYSLGAVLYFLLTFERPIDGDSPQELMVNTLNKKLIPPSEKKSNLMIPKSLDAVVMKAMSFNKKDRYQSVSELAFDISAFVGGFATSAEKAGVFIKLLLLLKRHKAIASILFLFFISLISFFAYLTYDYYKQWGDWTKVYSCDFSLPEKNIKDFRFLNELNAEATSPWRVTSNGLLMRKNEWLWLKNIKIRGDCKFVVKIICNGSPAPLELFLNSCIKPLKRMNFVPPGYSCQFGAWNGRGNFISKNHTSFLPSTTNNTSSDFSLNTVHEIIFERKQEKVSLLLDGKTSLSIVDFFPPSEVDAVNIGMRSFSPSTTILSIEVYRWALPEKPLPTLAGDVLAEYMHFSEAISKYLMIAKDCKEDDIAALALLKAFIIASSNNITDQLEIMNKIKTRMTEEYSSTICDTKLREQEILFFWRKKDYSRVSSLLPELFHIAPTTKIILRILQLKHEQLPDDILQVILRYLKLTKNVRELNIAGIGVQSLEALRGMNIVSLDCSRNNIKDLSPLKNMHLVRLLSANCNINSLDPLIGMKLKELIISKNKIKSLKPLLGMPIKRLRCRLNQIKSLEPLINMPLERLECGGNQISSLQALKGMPLQFLGCRKNKIVSLEPLKGMKLISLDCQDNPIKSIAVLAGMPLKELFLNDCPVQDLTPLKFCSDLEKLTIPIKCRKFDFLKNLPDLKYIDSKWNVILPKAEIFWQSYEK